MIFGFKFDISAFAANIAFYRTSFGGFKNGFCFTFYFNSTKGEKIYLGHFTFTMDTFHGNAPPSKYATIIDSARGNVNVCIFEKHILVLKGDK